MVKAIEIYIIVSFANGFFVYRYSDLLLVGQCCFEKCPTNIKFVVLILDSFNLVIL